MIAKRTITSLFMIPTLNIPKGMLKKYGFIEGYSLDKKVIHPYENAAYLLFKPLDLISFNDFLEQEYARTSDLIDDYDYDNGHVVLVYLLDTNFFEDFELIKKGKYSETSLNFQKLFPKEIDIIINSEIHEKESLQHRIFKKCEILKEAIEEKIGESLPENIEVWEMFDINKETLKL